MVAVTKESSKAFTPVSQLASWARQGIESFVAAQKLLFDHTAQQNALVTGMVRKGLHEPRLSPVDTIAKIADSSVENLTAAGKILLDLAAGETALVADWAKQGPALPAARALPEVVRHRVDTFVDMQKRLLDLATEQTHAVAESYRKGELPKIGGSVAEVATRAFEGFVETEKRFLLLAALDVAVASKGDTQGRTAARNQLKMLTQLAREGVEKYVNAQQKLLNLAIDQLESTGKATGEHIEAVRKEVSTSWGELTQKSIASFVVAQKSLRDLAAKPLKAMAADKTRETSPARARGKKRAVRTRETA
jgi:hypothetical protein